MKAGVCLLAPQCLELYMEIDSLNPYMLNEWTGMTVAIQVAFGEINDEERSAVASSSLRQVRQC